MIYGLYLSAQGAETQSKRLDVISNNLANAQTGAFKRDLALFQENRPFDLENQTADDSFAGLNESTGGVTLAGVATDFSDGALVQTRGIYDVAITGPGFLQVSDGQQQLLTRNGKLSVNANGELVTQDSGHRVLGESGAPMTIGSQEIEIATDGTIFELGSDGARSRRGRLGLVTVDSTDGLEKVGNSFYRSAGETQPADADVQLHQGFVESSGTHSVLEMMQLIEASRAFETNVNMIKFQDEALGQLLQTVPRR
jgi:flagellar basal body rod protein FlgG